MTHTCKKGGGSDISGKCKECRRISNLAYRLKRSGGGKVNKAKKTSIAQASAPAPTTPALEIEQGYGIKAWIDDPYLMVQQADHDQRIDTLCLSRAELRQLIEKFSGWASQ